MDKRLEELLGSVAEWRADQAAMREGLLAVQTRISKTEDGKLEEKYRGELATIKASMAQTENTARLHAIRVFNATGEKKVSDGASIRMTKTIVEQSTEKQLRQWALDNMPIIMRVDMKAFRDLVKLGVVPAEVAYVDEKPTVALKRDLSAWLV